MDSPVAFLGGPRQSGKSTLVQALGKEDALPYRTFDRSTVLAAAASDPEGFLAGFAGPVILDEVQRVPELFLAIKAEVDADRRPGRFLLTGSADVLLLPRLADTLAGRMEILTLWPLAQCEIEGSKGDWIDALFRSEPLPEPPAADRDDLLRRIVVGGYPEALTRTGPARLRAWFDSYVTTVLQREVRDLATIDGMHVLPRLLRVLATRTATILNYADLARAADLPQTTLKRYLTLLEASFLFQPIPAWSGNLGKRLVKSPKVLLVDSGLHAHLLGADEDRLRAEPNLLGPILESFVAGELRKLASWSDARPDVLHFRTHAQQEVDFVLEDRAGRLVGIEVKAGASVGANDFRGLKALRELVGDRFLRGVVLHAGRESVGFDRQLAAVPLTALWAAGTPG